jgi:putative phosphoesterase
MRVGIVSDVHGNLAGLDAALAALGPVDHVLFGGDLLGYYFDSAAVVDRLQELSALCILGNHDVYFLSHIGEAKTLAPPVNIPSPAAYLERYGPALERAAVELGASRIEWIAGLSPQRTIELGGKRILLTHGSPWRPVDEYVYPDHDHFERFGTVDADVVVMGHTHRPLVRREGKVLLVNPGSCGQPRDYDSRAAGAVLEIGEGVSCEIRRAAYDRTVLLARCRELAPATTLLVELLTRGDPPTPQGAAPGA